MEIGLAEDFALATAVVNNYICRLLFVRRDYHSRLVLLALVLSKIQWKQHAQNQFHVSILEALFEISKYLQFFVHILSFSILLRRLL